MNNGWISNMCVCHGLHHWLTKHRGNFMKGQLSALLFPSPELSSSLQDYHSLHPLFTMMLYKPLVSLVAVLAAASSVAASVTPVARQASDYPPPNLTPVSESECNTGSMQCCSTFTSTSNPLTGPLSGLLGLDALLDPALGVGLSCISIIGGTQW